MSLLVYAIIVVILFTQTCRPTPKELCMTAGDPCVNNENCCANFSCILGTCTPNTCINEYELCRPGLTCCNGLKCTGDQCLKPCVQGGKCTVNSECCKQSDCFSGYCDRLCKLVDEKCSYPEDSCCDNLCTNGTCQPVECKDEGQSCHPFLESCCPYLLCSNRTCVPACIEQDKKCSSYDLCCDDNVCVNGTCRVCTEMDNKCITDIECCNTDPYNPMKCVHGFCRRYCYSKNSKCKRDQECCSEFCSNGICAERCKAENRKCSVTSDCCKGVCGKLGVCRKADPCTKIGNTCGSHDACCLSFCWNGICRLPCTELNRKCDIANPDCCDGAFCVNGRCRSKPCVFQGQKCIIDGECCSNYCSNKTCQFNCVLDGQKCSSNIECCSNTCDNETCATKCKPNTQYCDFDFECCDNNCIHRRCLHKCSGEKGKCITGNDCCNTDNCIAGICGRDCFSVGYLCKKHSECCSLWCNNGMCEKFPYNDDNIFDNVC